MYLSRLSLTDFRSWPQADVAFGPGVSVLVGPNGVGKTNLVEAVGYLSTFASHRVAGDASLVRLEAEHAVVRGLAVQRGRELAVEVQIVPGKANRARVNRVPLPRAREAMGLVRTVTFAPEDLALVRGDPGERRRFLDELLVTRSPRYASVRSDYDRVVRQRSALLKTARSAGDLRTLDTWDGHLARHGAALLAGRMRLVDDLTTPVRSAYAQVAPESVAVDLRYRGSVEAVQPSDDEHAIAEALLAQLARVRQQEVERGVCLVGPHRDDLEARLGDGPAKGYASHGESWSLALALRLGSFALLRDDPGDGGASDPVLVLDDVFAELDVRRRRALAELAGDAEQVLVTAAVSEDVPDALRGDRYEVAEGRIRGPV